MCLSSKIGIQENTYTGAIQDKWLNDKIALNKVHDKEIRTPLYAHLAGISHRLSKGLDLINIPDRPPLNFRDAMEALDPQAWPAAYYSEYLRFKQREIFKVVQLEPGVKIHDTITRLKYKEDNDEFLNARCICAQEGISRFQMLASRNLTSKLRCSRHQRHGYYLLWQQPMVLKS